MNYNSDITLGETYVDEATGFEGTATSVCFYAQGPELVKLEALNSSGKLTKEWFDAPRLNP